MCVIKDAVLDILGLSWIEIHQGTPGLPRILLCSVILLPLQNDPLNLQKRWDVTAVRIIRTATGLRTWMKSVNIATVPYLPSHATR